MPIALSVIAIRSTVTVSGGLVAKTAAFDAVFSAAACGDGPPHAIASVIAAVVHITYFDKTIVHISII